MPESLHLTLLHASNLTHLFRALALAEFAEHRALVQSHIVQIVNALSGTDGGFVLLASGPALTEAARAMDYPALDLAVARVHEGIVREGDVTAGPLYVRGKIEGVLATLGEDSSETLAALITLASAALESARDYEELRTENVALKVSAGLSDNGILGETEPVRHLRALISRVAPQDATVLVLGESGTGKELVARAIHAASLRARRPFIAINCAALTETLLESELFGHERGAFTGAVAQKKGKLEMAEGGTVFLDEVGELAPSLQAKLLRVLQEREFERVGGTVTMPLNIRLVAATNRDLTGPGFRPDLYHRLNVITLRTPPLRDRAADIPLLATRFVQTASARCHRRVSGIAPETAEVLMRYKWPGNVRELENAIEHAVILGTADVLLPEDLPESVLQGLGPAEIASRYHAAVGTTRRDCIEQAWREAAGDHNQAARILGIHPNSLRRLIRHMGLRESLAHL